MKENVSVIKKNGALEPYDPEKITAAITKSASRVGHVFTDDEVFDVLEFVEKRIDRSGSRRVPVVNMHNYVEAALDLVNPRVAKSYRDYRNWKEEWAKDFSDLFEKANKIMYNEPKSLDTAFDVIGDVVLSAASDSSRSRPAARR